MRIDTPLTVSQKLRKAIIGLNPVAYYPLDEQSGNALNRAPSTQGTLDGTVTGATQAQTGQVGRAYSFDGVNDSVSIGDIPVISDATAISIAVMVRTSNITADHFIVGLNPGSSGFFLIADDVGSSARTDTFKIGVQEDAASGNTSAFIEGATGANSVAWKMVVMTFTANSSTGLHLYVNGSEDANSPVTTANIANAGLSNTAIKIGETPAGALDANALIQHVALFNRALTTAEALKLAQLAGLA